jgi:hypothetical protein
MAAGLLPSTAQAGKHDFRLHSNMTTNASAKPPEFSMESLAKAVKMLEDMPPEQECIDHARVGKDYMKMLERIATRVEEKPVYGGGGMLGILGRTRIILDEELPPDVCEMRNSKGKVLARLELKK